MAETAQRAAVVIEDDADIRNLLEAILAQAGFACQTRDSGLAGIEAQDADHFGQLACLLLQRPGRAGRLLDQGGIVAWKEN